MRMKILTSTDCSVVNVKSNFKSFIKGEGIRILRNTSNEIELHKRMQLFIEKLKVRGYKILMIEKTLCQKSISKTDRKN
jgi:hypothetical protein